MFFAKALQLVVLAFMLLASNEQLLVSAEVKEKIEYFEVHLNNPALTALLKQRCENGTLIFDLRKKGSKVAFMHIPKAGGSSMREFLAQIVSAEKLRPVNHEHFLTVMSTEPNPFLSIILREPLARSLSFYAYVKSRLKLSKPALKNFMWTTTFKANSSLEWAALPLVHAYVEHSPLEFFDRNFKGLSDCMLDYSRIRKLPEPREEKAVVKNASLDTFMAYTDDLPAEYQCKEHLKAAFTLLKYFPVVGVLEKLSDFEAVFLRRTGLKAPPSPPPPATANKHTAKNIINNGINNNNNEVSNSTIRHENKSNGNVKSAVIEEYEAIERNLQGALFCPRLLWRIAEAISDADAVCER